MAELTTMNMSLIDRNCVVLDLTNNEPLVLQLARSFDPIDLIILPIIALIGVPANFCFLFVVWKTPTMRTNLNKYLCTLAIVDISVFVVGLGERYLAYLSPIVIDAHSKTFGSAGCVIQILPEFAYFASLLMLSLISLERYYAVCKPLKHRTFVGGKRTRRQILFVFLITFIIFSLLIPSRAIPTWYCFLYPQNGKYDDFPEAIVFCGSISDLAAIISAICEPMAFYIALLANLMFSTRIILELRKWDIPKKSATTGYRNRGVSETDDTDLSTSVTSVSATQTGADDTHTPSTAASPSTVKTISSGNSHHNYSLTTVSNKEDMLSSNKQKLIDKQRSNQRAVTRMLMINGLVYFLCNAPFTIFYTVYSILNNFDIVISNELLTYAFNAGQCLFYLNSALNPFIYGVMNASYRAAFANAILPCRDKK
ncbi:thyrotropin-releasing hormone receptor-like [Apostichopus japonicus]|uniref:thyrotropin-releasing hormone receptor-like n=1 Tax=Stichopus japonicus TaxID=307972 RepID=UPI003AB411F0